MRGKVQTKRLDRDIWTTITQKRYVQKSFSEDAFSGIAALLHIDAVSKESRWEFGDATETICGAGVKWLELLPENENHMITAMIDPQNRIMVWYIDVIAGRGFAEDGVATYQDLYLDVIVRPDGGRKIDDRDELDDALQNGYISPETHAMALREQEKLESGLLRDISKLSALCEMLRKRMEALV